MRKFLSILFLVLLYFGASVFFVIGRVQFASLFKAERTIPRW